jgi:hypothetical protein
LFGRPFAAKEETLDRRLGDSRRVGYSYLGSEQLSGRQPSATGLVLGWAGTGSVMG